MREGRTSLAIAWDQKDLRFSITNVRGANQFVRSRRVFVVGAVLALAGRGQKLLIASAGVLGAHFARWIWIRVRSALIAISINDQNLVGRANIWLATPLGEIRMRETLTNFASATFQKDLYIWTCLKGAVGVIASRVWIGRTTPTRTINLIDLSFQGAWPFHTASSRYICTLIWCTFTASAVYSYYISLIPACVLYATTFCSIWMEISIAWGARSILSNDLSCRIAIVRFAFQTVGGHSFDASYTSLPICSQNLRGGIAALQHPKVIGSGDLH